MAEVVRLIRETDLSDLLDGIRVLDLAAGADDRFFRYRVRQWIETQRQVRERERLVAEVGRD